MHATFAKKTFTNVPRSVKFAKVFSLKSLPLYGMVHLSLLHIRWWYIYALCYLGNVNT